MKVKPTNEIKRFDHLKLTKDQMKKVKGGDDDIFVNSGDALGSLDFGG